MPLEDQPILMIEVYRDKTSGRIIAAGSGNYYLDDGASRAMEKFMEGVQHYINVHGGGTIRELEKQMNKRRN